MGSTGYFTLAVGGRQLRIEQRAAVIVTSLLMIALLLASPVLIAIEKQGAAGGFEITIDIQVAFDRGLSGDRVGQHTAPPLTPVITTITATVSGGQVDNATLIDYFPNSWTIIDANGGIISVYDETYSKIEWHVGTVSGSVLRTYVIRSPERTIPPTNYYFHSELIWDGGSETSADWMVTVEEEINEIELLSKRDDFQLNEKPEFRFRHEKISDGSLTWENVDVTAQIISPRGQALEISPDFIFENNGEFLVNLERPREFRPGLYKIILEIEEDGENQDFEQDFSWGVLAINVNKSIYLPNETAYIQMAALGDDGHTIWDANLKLEITSPSGQVTSPEVQKSGECGPNNVTDNPDYFAYYQVGEVGTYQMKLTNLDSGYQITDSFEVRESVPFDVERIGPTRIYPPASYEMIFCIKANQDFWGQVVEQVPVSFEIISHESTQIRTQNDVKEIVWQVDWQAGETYELEYQFDAPDISPYLYLLGPLEIGDFKEIRQWQIAADSPATTEALIVYGDDIAGTPKYRIWDGTSWGDELSALSVGSSAINWVVLKACPKRDEYVLATIDAAGVVKAQVYSSGSWGNLQTIATVANAVYRGLDVAYETISGDAIVVAADGDADPTWWSWNGSSWNASGTVNLSTTGNSYWIKMASDPTSDEIILIAQDASRYYRAQVWNGSSWGNEFSAGTILSPLAGVEALAVEYETSGDQAIIVYANGTASSFYWNSWNGSSWGTAATKAIGDDFYWGTLKADPNSDKLVLNYVDYDTDIGNIIWNGSAWGTYSERDTSGAAKTDRPIDAEFESISGHSSHILAAYSDTTQGRSQHYDGSTWAAEVSAAGGVARTVQVRRTGDGKILAIFFDTTNSDYDFGLWDSSSSSWTITEKFEDSPSVTASPWKEPFMIATDIYEAPQWNLIESWTGTVSAPAPAPAWQLTETWSGAISAPTPAEWKLFETWTGTITTSTPPPPPFVFPLPVFYGLLTMFGALGGGAVVYVRWFRPIKPVISLKRLKSVPPLTPFKSLRKLTQPAISIGHLTPAPMTLALALPTGPIKPIPIVKRRLQIRPKKVVPNIMTPTEILESLERAPALPKLEVPTKHLEQIKRPFELGITLEDLRRVVRPLKPSVSLEELAEIARPIAPGISLKRLEQVVRPVEPGIPLKRLKEEVKSAAKTGAYSDKRPVGEVPEFLDRLRKAVSGKKRGGKKEQA